MGTLVSLLPSTPVEAIQTAQCHHLLLIGWRRILPIFLLGQSRPLQLWLLIFLPATSSVGKSFILNVLVVVQVFSRRLIFVVSLLVFESFRRGGATNSHSGNKKFRALVKDHQDRYLKAKKRDKPAVASIIVDMIREKGGRFLRRYDTDPTGQVRWCDIGDDRAREKTCQALRENAPELRRRRLASSSSVEDEKRTKRSESFSPKLSPNLSSSSSLKSPAPVPASEITLDHSQRQTRQSEVAIHQNDEEGPIMIRPYTRLLPGQIPVDPIPLEKLSPHDRSLYLQDFLPPCPHIRSRPDTVDQQVVSALWPVPSSQ